MVNTTSIKSLNKINIMRNCVTEVKVNSNGPVADMLHKKKFPSFINIHNLKPSQIHSSEKTGLHWKGSPTQPCIWESKLCCWCKMTKEYITATCCWNAITHHNLNTVVLTKIIWGTLSQQFSVQTGTWDNFMKMILWHSEKQSEWWMQNMAFSRHRLLSRWSTSVTAYESSHLLEPLGLGVILLPFLALSYILSRYIWRCRKVGGGVVCMHAHICILLWI
jgi:hypothetical protein